MTIQQVIHKLRTASNENWYYIDVDEQIDSSVAYDLIIDGEHQTIILKAFIDPLVPDSFATKQLIDAILNSRFVTQAIQNTVKQK